MFTLEEKQYLLKVLAKEKRRSFWPGRKLPDVHDKITEKLEQMVRNEIVNKKHL
jgi:hypothetical protein